MSLAKNLDCLDALLGKYKDVRAGELISAAWKHYGEGQFNEAAQAFEGARDTFGKKSEEWQCLEDWRLHAQAKITARAPVSNVHPYAAELARSVEQRGTHRRSLRLRTLLNGFGYYRRTQAIVVEVTGHLLACGLAVDLAVNAPPSLDDRVTLTVAEPSPAKPSGAPKQKAPTPATDALDAISQAVRATVEVYTDGGSGSGFIVHPDGLVVTARHVVEEEGAAVRMVKVRLFAETPEEQIVEGVVFRSHRRLDFALVWLLADGPFPILSIGDPQMLRHAQTVFAIGSPAGMPSVVSRGIVSNPNAHYNLIQCIQTDAAIDHGNSGGPLVTEDGQVVGINLWGIGNFDAAKFVVPIDYLTEDLERAVTEGRNKCLKVPYCPICGHTEFDPPTWYCRNCGIQLAADTQTTDEEEE